MSLSNKEKSFYSCLHQVDSECLWPLVPLWLRKNCSFHNQDLCGASCHLIGQQDFTTKSESSRHSIQIYLSEALFLILHRSPIPVPAQSPLTSLSFLLKPIFHFRKFLGNISSSADKIRNEYVF